MGCDCLPSMMLDNLLRMDLKMNISENHKSVYVYIGQRIRERRKRLNLNQAELANLMGFSYQQMQKYESGASHVSAGKLLLFAKILNVPLSYFYDGINLEQTIGKRIETNIIQKVRTDPLSILLVENNPADVMLFKNAIGACSQQTDVHIIHNSETVMDFLQNHEVKYGRKLPDIIILELSIPKIGGMELLKAIKKNPRTVELPVIILTNSINVKDMVESYKQGAAGFIQKSIDFKEYSESMETIVKYWSKVAVLPANAAPAMIAYSLE